MLAPWREWLNDLVDSLLKRFLPDPGNGADLVQTLKFLGYALILALALLVAYAVYRWLRAQELPARRVRAPRRLAADSRDRLLAAFREALARGEYARAARLRWRLFQTRLDRPAGETQSELLARAERAGAAPPALGLEPAEANALMFGGAAET